MEQKLEDLTSPELSDEDSVITIVLEGKTSVPKAVNFKDINAFQLLALGEWMLLKGRQMIVASETAERDKQNIAGNKMDPRILKPT